MLRCRSRTVPVGCLLLGGPLLAACGRGGSAAEAAVTVPDGSGPEVSVDAASYLRPEARSGLPGGSSCDSGAQCLSGACPLGACSDWAHAMRITVDTTVTGADIQETVVDFPLLIRLRATNFAFAEARPDGADVRFVDGDGRNLDHQTERWDAARGVADLWVLVPTLAGNGAENTITMYWGNPLAAPTDAGSAVFGAFTCVLHMGDDPDGVATHLADATGLGNTGLLQNPAPGNSVADGIAGAALTLDASGSYLTTTTQMGDPAVASVALWFKTTATARAGLAGFASKRLGSDVLFDRSLGLDEQGRIFFGVLHEGDLVTVTSLVGYNDGQWHLAVARLGSNGQYLFVDGEVVADDPTTTGTNSVSGYWRFGEEPVPNAPPSYTDAAPPAGNFFAGSLDEIRVSTDAASDDWIKLSYATQRPDATAVRYQRVP